MLIAMPANLAMTYILGAWQETLLLFGLIWMYKDLQGGESMIGRNFIISIAAGLYDSSSVRVAYGTGTTLHENGFYWILIISAVILATIHIQELKDAAGEQLRNGQTVSLVLGGRVGRWSVAVFILA